MSTTSEEELLIEELLIEELLIEEPPIADPPLADPPIAEPPIAEPPVAEPPMGKPPITRHVVDEDGDLVLRVGEARHTSSFNFSAPDFLVCSSTLRRGSPVWKKMLFGEFQEAKPAGGDWIVALPDDHSSTMSVLLHIMHANFSQVPPQSLSEVYDLLILMDKYDALNFMKPWAKDWLATTEPAVKATYGISVYTSTRLCISAYVALQMGAESIAYNLVSHISRNSSIDSGGYLAVCGVRLSLCSNMLDTVGPHSVFEMIRTMREAHIQHVVDEVWKALDVAMSSSRYNNDSNFDLLGRFWHAVTEKRGGLLPKSSCDIAESPTQLLASLGSVVNLMNSGYGNTYTKVFKAALEPLDDEALRPLWKMDAEFMSGRRKMSGISL